MSSNQLLYIAKTLRDQLSPLRFGPPAAYVYNPLEYAEASHFRYLEKYGKGRKRVVLLGMNPGPWGMVQTGVPFGEVNMVRDWLGIDEQVGKPSPEHPKRPVAGFSCSRSEVSGARLWGWAKERFSSPRNFFETFFVANYCPLAFLEESGRNLTPDKLPAAQQADLFDACDRALRDTIEVLKPEHVIGVGKFAEKRATKVLSDLDIHIGWILHPSPASPAANRDWQGKISEQLREYGIEA